MSGLLIRWLITSLTILMIPQLISGVHVDGLGTAVAAAAILGVLNTLIKPVLVLFTLPLTVLSLGFFLLVINALVFQMAGFFVSGLQVASFGSAFLAGLIVSLVHWLTEVKVQSHHGKRTIIVRRGGTIDMERRGPNKWG